MRESGVSSQGNAGLPQVSLPLGEPDAKRQVWGAPNTIPRSCSMDVEHINAIGNTLSDLTRRTLDLRGFL